LKTKLSAGKTFEEAATKCDCTKGFAKHLKGRKSQFVDEQGFQTVVD